MYAFFYFTSCSILLLIAETLLRSVGLMLPLLGFFLPAAAFVVSSRMAVCFAIVAGVAMDFVLGYVIPWDGLLLPLLTLPAFFLHGKRPSSDVLEFLAGALIPAVLAFPHVRTVLTTPDAFASLMMSCLVGVIFFPIMVALVAYSARRLKIGVAVEGKGGS
jgi:hypothetical protein